MNKITLDEYKAIGEGITARLKNKLTMMDEGIGTDKVADTHEHIIDSYYYCSWPGIRELQQKRNKTMNAQCGCSCHSTGLKTILTSNPPQDCCCCSPLTEDDIIDGHMIVPANSSICLTCHKVWRNTQLSTCECRILNRTAEPIMKMIDQETLDTIAKNVKRLDIHGETFTAILERIERLEKRAEMQDVIINRIITDRIKNIKVDCPACGYSVEVK